MTQRRSKPYDERVCIVYTDGPGRAMPEHAGKVFAVVGSFDNFTGKPDLQNALEMLLAGFNLNRSNFHEATVHLSRQLR